MPWSEIPDQGTRLEEQDVDENNEIWDEYYEDDEPGYFHNGKFFWEEEEEEDQLRNYHLERDKKE